VRFFFTEFSQMRKWFKLFTALSVAAAMLCSASTVRADFGIFITSGTSSVTFDATTNTVAVAGGSITNATNGTFGSQGGGLTVTGAGTQLVTITGLQVNNQVMSATIGSGNSPGTPTVAALALSSIFISFGNATTLTIDVSDQGFTNPTGSPVTAMTSGSATASPTNKMDVGFAIETWLNPGNGLFAKTPPPLDNFSASIAPGMSAAEPGAFASVNAAAPYSLTLEMRYVPLQAGDAITDSSSALSVIGIPEPAGIILALTGLPFLGAGWLLRRRRKQA
jgi:hypothetical protein